MKEFPNERLDIIDRPHYFLENHGAHVRRYFPKYFEVSDFNRTAWVKEVCMQRYRQSGGNIIIIICGPTRTYKSSIGLCWQYWLMKNIYRRRKYNLMKLMFYGNRSEIEIMKTVGPNVVLLQDETLEEFGPGSRFAKKIVETQDDTLAKSTISKVKVRQILNPKELHDKRADICLIAWDSNMPELEKTDEVKEMDAELEERTGEIKYQYNKGENKKFEKAMEDIESFLIDYARVYTEFFLATRMVYRSLLFLKHGSRVVFKGYVLNTLPRQKWLIEYYIRGKQRNILKNMTTEAWKVTYKDQISHFMSVANLDPFLFKNKKDESIRIKRRDLKTVVDAHFAGTPKSVVDQILNILIATELPEQGITVS